jgi:predicted AAA+ superfamily ATPase
MIFERLLYKDLKTWKQAKYRKPLVLKGARQVGKTSLLKLFGASDFSDTAYFNFDEQRDLKNIFEVTKDVQRILQNLSLVHGRVITPDTLIILDEIQECPEALNALKYFCENAPEYPIVSAGSLLGITLGKEKSFPVGKVDFLEVMPLSFYEFLQGVEPSLARYVKSINKVEPIPDLFFNHLLEIFKMYFISGGMPEAARMLATEKNIDLTQKCLKDILSSYSLDFAKHPVMKDVAKIDYLWKSIPSQLSKENKKFIYQVVREGARAREYEDALLWLIQAGLVLKVNRSSKPHIPLSAYDELSAFKLYLLDVGLLRQHAGLDSSAFLDKSALFTEFKGALTENYILQSLVRQFETPLRYWVSEGEAEIDFLLQYKNQVIPIEVKADQNIRSKSLSFYHKKFQPPIRIRYSLRNVSFDEGLLNIPLFLADSSSDMLHWLTTE